MFQIPESVPHLVRQQGSFLLLGHWRTVHQSSKLLDQHLDVEVMVEDRLTVSALVEVEHELGLVALVTRLSVQ